VSEAEASAAPPHRARSLVADSATIVFSILLAFAIDAAWDARREREEETRFLRAIDAEISLNLGRIDDARKFRAWKREAALELLALSVQPDVEASRVDAPIADLTWWDVGRWQTSAIDTLLTGGKLALVEDQTLRQELVSLPRTSGVLLQLERQDETTFRATLMPYLIRESSLPQITNSFGVYPPGFYPDPPADEATQAPYGNVPVAVTRDHRELLRRADFLGVVTQTYWDQADVLFHLDITERNLREVQAAIRAELGEAASATETRP